MDDEVSQLQPVEKLRRDIKQASITLSDDEARFLVDGYYTMQEGRIRANNQVRALTESTEPHDVLSWLGAQWHVMENQIRGALDVYSNAHPVGVWSRSIVGIGPVLAAGLLAHIDMEKAPTAGNIWNFAGLNPGVTWGKGERRPWNARLKVLCWKIGESFVRVHNNPRDYYGKIYVERKTLEQERNAKFELEEQAHAALASKRFKKTTDAYKHYSAGQLPPKHIHQRAKRYAVKLFLAHWHEVAFWHHFNRPPPEPYAIVHLGHAHRSTPPNWTRPR